MHQNEQSAKLLLNTKNDFLLFSGILIAIFTIIYFIKIPKALYCNQSPIVRWKFAIYTGECNDETGYDFLKMKGTGFFEHLHLKNIPCVDK